MKYIIVSNKKIKGVFCSNELPNGAIEVPSNFDGVKNEKLVYFNSDWTRKTAEQLVEEKIIKLKKGYKVENGSIVEMSVIEKIENGIIKLANDEKLENGQIVKLSTQEKIEKGIIDKNDEEYRIYRIDELKGYLRSTDWYVIRSIDIGKEMPEEVAEKRAEARKEISELKVYL